MEIYLVNTENHYAKSLMEKLAKNAKPGAFIELNGEEIDVYNDSSDFKIVHIGSETNQKIVELDPDKKYVFILDPAKDNIDDAVEACKHLGIEAGFIRSCNDGLSNAPYEIIEDDKQRLTEPKPLGCVRVK